MRTSNRELIESELDTVVAELSAKESEVRAADTALRALRAETTVIRECARNLRMALFALDGQDKSREDAAAEIEDALSKLKER